jgi:hypothetical protein
MIDRHHESAQENCVIVWLRLAGVFQPELRTVTVR